MPPLPVLLLPGLDGTGDLFAPMLQTAPPDLQPIVVALPPLGDYAALWNAIRPRIPRGSFAIVAESFSGPLALAIAREAGERVKALILCNTFVTPPVSTLLRLLPWSLLFSLPLPEWVIRRFFIGREAPPELARAVRAAVAKMPPGVLAARMRAVFRLPKTPRWDVPAPVMFLAGTEDGMVRPEPGAQVILHAIRGPHLLLQTKPAEAWAAIAAFIASSSAARTTPRR
ncbi:MAG TPA: hypothetical protein VHK90_05735 [Thermoanaerobaculia bacterium]|nr:hypothetical protein [Thermoanaerobaculia bacterium]